VFFPLFLPFFPSLKNSFFHRILCGFLGAEKQTNKYKNDKSKR
jgi:hypothetical protein